MAAGMLIFRAGICAGTVEIIIRPELGYLRPSLFGGLSMEAFSPGLGALMVGFGGVTD